MKILVIGGKGMIGKIVVDELLKAGIEVVLLVRDVKKLSASTSQHNKLTFIKGDVRRRVDIEKQLSRISDLTHIYFHPPASKNHRSNTSTDLEGTSHIVSSMGDNIHFLKLSEIGANEDPHFFDITQKYRSERLIRDNCPNWTIFRPTWFMESIPQLLTVGPLSMSFGKQENPIWWLAGRDYAKTLVAAIRYKAISNQKIYTVQGPQPIRMPDAIKLYNRLSGAKKISLSLPLWSLALPSLFFQEYHFNRQVMNYYNTRKEVFEAGDTYKELHTPELTLAMFAKTQRQLENTLGL